MLVFSRGMGLGVARLKNLSEIYDCNGKRWEDRADSAVQRAEKAKADKAKLVEALRKIVAWYDGECLFEETLEIFEMARAVLKEVL